MDTCNNDNDAAGDVVVVVGHHSATSENATTKPLHLLFIFIYHAYVCC